MTEKIPPQALDAEEALLSAILVQPDILDDLAGIISKEMFYKQAHRIIYSAITEIHKAGDAPDLLSVKEKLSNSNNLDEIGGLMYLVSITEKVVTVKYAMQHAYYVKESFYRREYIRLSHEIMSAAYDESNDFRELKNFAESSLFQISEDTVRKDPQVLSEIYSDTLIHIEKISKLKTELTGVPSGITELDRMTLGFQNSDLILLAARPSMGKTAFSLFVSKNAAELGYKVLFFSLEMNKRQLSYRVISDRFTDISSLKLGRDVNWPKLEKEVGRNYVGNIFIDDTPAINVNEIRSISRKMKKKLGIDLIIVDYLQLARGDSKLRSDGNRYVGDISKTLKSIAKEIDVPVMALSQLNRSVESRPNPLPILSDLRDSGELEQDADIVIFLTRFLRLPEKYWTDEQGNDMKNKAYIDVAKHRNGRSGKILTTASEDAMHWGFDDTFNSI